MQLPDLQCFAERINLSSTADPKNPQRLSNMNLRQLHFVCETEITILQVKQKLSASHCFAIAFMQLKPRRYKSLFFDMPSSGL